MQVIYIPRHDPWGDVGRSFGGGITKGYEELEKQRREERLRAAQAILSDVQNMPKPVRDQYFQEYPEAVKTLEFAFGPQGAQAIKNMPTHPGVEARYTAAKQMAELFPSLTTEQWMDMFGITPKEGIEFKKKSWELQPKIWETQYEGARLELMDKKKKQELINKAAGGTLTESEKDQLRLLSGMDPDFTRAYIQLIGDQGFYYRRKGLEAGQPKATTVLTGQLLKPLQAIYNDAVKGIELYKSESLAGKRPTTTALSSAIDSMQLLQKNAYGYAGVDPTTAVNANQYANHLSYAIHSTLTEEFARAKRPEQVAPLIPVTRKFVQAYIDSNPQYAMNILGYVRDQVAFMYGGDINKAKKFMKQNGFDLDAFVLSQGIKSGASAPTELYKQSK